METGHWSLCSICKVWGLSLSNSAILLHLHSSDSLLGSRPFQSWETQRLEMTTLSSEEVQPFSTSLRAASFPASRLTEAWWKIDRSHANGDILISVYLSATGTAFTPHHSTLGSLQIAGRSRRSGFIALQDCPRRSDTDTECGGSLQDHTTIVAIFTYIRLLLAATHDDSDCILAGQKGS